MADVTVSTNWRFVYHDPKCIVPHATNPAVLYFVYIDRSDNDLKYRKSTNGGATWGAAVSVHAGDVTNVAVWADWWTPGDTGTKIHIAYMDDALDDFLYRSLDVASDTLGTEVTPVASTALSGGACSITKTRGGNLLLAYTGSASVQGMSRSVDGGANWTSRANPFEGDSLDGIAVYPANLADNQDMWALFIDQSASEVSLKTYDDSADSWSEASIATGVPQSFTVQVFQGAIRFSDGHLLVAIANGTDVSTADLLTYDIANASSIVAKTNVITNADDWGAVGIFIDQRNNDVYVSHIGKSDGSETYNGTCKLYYNKSTDNMATWSADVAFTEAAATNFQYLFSPPMGARFILAWMHDDSFFAYSLYTNAVLSINMAAARRAGWVNHQEPGWMMRRLRDWLSRRRRLRDLTPGALGPATPVAN